MIRAINSTNINSSKAPQSQQAFKSYYPKPKKQQSEFKKNFNEEVKQTMPIMMALSAVWTIFDVRKAPTYFLPQLILNATILGLSSLGVSAVASVFKTKSNKS